ncbi:MAG: 30S ribosomal protein S20 [Flavobacteriales bacterium]|nr:30S ribosomal protein S20 [Flavobacteriales bacterium]|tara:strand:+ start:492 stop:746 length:255 start_codon:yes stop_codon:yes gene_type:complete
MANHKSAIKRIRQSEKRRLLNKYFHKTTRNAISKLRSLTSKKEATALLPKVVAMLDKLTKRNIIHKNKSSNLKSKLTKHVNAMS